MLINAIDLDTRPPEELVKGMIPRVGCGIAYGPSYWAKSLLFGGELALAVANGTPFLGRETVYGSVALCLGEGLYDAGVRKQARIERQKRDNAADAALLAEAEDEETAAEWLAGQAAYTDERLFIETEAFALPVDTRGEINPGMRQVMDGLGQIPGLELVILDALADFTGNASLSHDSSANRIMLGMKAMAAELGCCVLAIHHPTAKGDKMLGALRLLNASDFVFEIRPVRGSPGGSGPMVAALACCKNKYGRPFEPVQYAIEPAEWKEPATDEAGNVLEDEPPVLVTSATVRLYQPKAPGTLRLPAENSGRPDNPAQLRLAEAVPAAPPKRTGLRASARPATAGTTFSLKGM